eukprot:TRINITY_DN24891_c0_g1_i1.p1 TRINITY_DN24891_c0_g1~~TRINITY_DN24891_c0_g1_i1.p1  ORF type:complete len:448 (+),score=29.60 TRINITY_DN24891_c0_g1_i1:93-1436(+)
MPRSTKSAEDNDGELTTVSSVSSLQDDEAPPSFARKKARSSSFQERTLYISYYVLEIHFTSIFIAAFAILLVFFMSRTAHRFYVDQIPEPRAHQFVWFNLGNLIGDMMTTNLIFFLMWCLYENCAFCLVKPIVIPATVYLVVANVMKLVFQMSPSWNFGPFPLYTAVPITYVASGFIMCYNLKKAGYESPTAEIRRVIFAILYNAVLFGFYSEWWMEWVWGWQSDVAKMIARVVVHPLIWETALFTGRMAARQVKLAKDANLIVIPAQMCSALSGRIVITSFNRIEYTIATALIVGLQEICLQLTKKERDWFVCRVLYSKERRAKIFAEANPHLSWMTFNDHMILETSGIWTAPFMSALYQPDVNKLELFIQAAASLLVEIAADSTVIAITRYMKKPVVEIWYSLDRFRYFWVVWLLNMVAVMFFLGLWRLVIQTTTELVIQPAKYW